MSVDLIGQLARRAALVAHAEHEEQQARTMLDRGLCARAAEHAEEALHARLAALAIGDGQ